MKKRRSIMKKHALGFVLLCMIGCGLIACASRSQVGPIRHGRALEDQGEYVRALKHYQRMKNPIVRQESTQNLHYLYGDILEAMLALNTGRDPEAYYALGSAYYEKALSIPQAQEVISNPDFDTTTYFSEQRNQLQSRAITALETATQRQPDHKETLLLRAYIHEERKEPEKAIQLYQQLLELNTQSADVLYRLGHLLYTHEQHEIGIKLAQEAVLRYPDHPKAHFVLGVLYEQEGMKDQAITAFQQTACADPHYIEAYSRIAQLLLMHEQPIDAERVLRWGFLNNPESFQLSIFYHSLKSVLDRQELQELNAIYSALVGERSANLQIEALEGRDFGPSPALEIRHLQLQQMIVKRQKPYDPACSSIEVNPYFDKLIARIQEKIEQIEPRLLASE
jgi:tetratricopeptide (TPR) repeat protein